MIQAIETFYKGYRFRSRLEARWAVFFDACGINYLYEYQGFELDGVRYLPDFWLPDHDLWFEVKGVWPDTKEQRKFSRLSDAIKSSPIAVAYGDVGSNLGACWFAGRILRHFTFISCPECEHIGFVAFDFHPMTKKPIYIYRLRCGHSPMERLEDNTLFGWQLSARILDAMEAARSARFEHGEQPRIERGRPKRK